MAAVTVTRSDLFPNTTVVKAYARNTFHVGQSGVPSGLAVAEGTMTSGSVTLEGLVAGQEYTVAAEVNGQWAYLGVQAPAAGTAEAAATPVATMKGLIAESFDSSATVVANKYKPATAGTLYKARIPIRAEVKVSNVLLYIAKEGATLTALENFLGLS